MASQGTERGLVRREAVTDQEVVAGRSQGMIISAQRTSNCSCCYRIGLRLSLRAIPTEKDKKTDQRLNILSTNVIHCWSRT